MKIGQLVGSVVETVVKIVVIGVAIMLIYKYALKAYDFGYQVFAQEPVSLSGGRTITVSVAEQDSVKDIGRMLEEQGLIRDGSLFAVQELLSGYHGKIKPGAYELNTAMTAEEMLAVMSAENTEEPDDTGNESAKDSGNTEEGDETADEGGESDGE